MIAPTCPYCGNHAVLVGGDVVYPHRPDLTSKKIWICHICAAWVGCHPGTETPLGRLANPELRRAKQAAHAAFDPLWRAKIHRDGCSKKRARSAAYRWLSQQLGTSPEETHIGMFDVDLCKRVVEVCRPYLRGAQ
ncbi:zinc-finger-containing protein [Telmatospirillum sp.]|uniref:zinc-finger-containing protein n=1 Tax=Telmatospirillum sp. TaxID=2079197 RepID=UPI00284540EF|nr:zinc-finger-containing protein [Telmatospirillum sp.]MDR3439846.1 zinc-finger-containing protein [Telmatospirillum sp.]